jgi:UDP-glucose:(heptosyl)LPS alpha-1,3-glucosyltransferase
MKIGVVRQRFVAHGGAERYLQAVVAELAARGHEVHVFANAWVGQDSAAYVFHRVPMVRVTSFLKVLSFALSSRKVIQRAGCDVIFSLERTLEQDVYRAGDGVHAEWLAQRRKYPGIGSAPINPLHLTLLRIERRTFSIECTRCIIANSNRGKEEIVRHYGFPSERITVIHNGVDLKRFQPAAREHSGRLPLLFVGTGWERKGLPYCIQALAKLPADTRLRVVGKGDAARYLRLAASLGVAERVEFAGHDVEVAREYAAADLLVHPAIYEPFANVCLEAMASGVPVVTSRVNGASEIVEHGRNGAIVEEPNDIGSLAAAIQMFADKSTREAASSAARKTAEQLPFSLNVTRTLEVLLSARRDKQ